MSVGVCVHAHVPIGGGLVTGRSNKRCIKK